jgi:hypothetical protein
VLQIFAGFWNEKNKRKIDFLIYNRKHKNKNNTFVENFIKNADRKYKIVVVGDQINLKNVSNIGHISRHKLKSLLQNTKYTGETKVHSFIDADKPNIIGMLDTFWTKRFLPKGLLSLNISNATLITDYGLALIARSSPNLKELTINGCSTLGDAGNIYR